MKWPAVKHGSPAEEALKKKFAVVAIPHLVIIDPDGKVVTEDGYADLHGRRSPEAAWRKWGTAKP